ncbi:MULTISPECIES: restriction endonuclease subunit S [unclassified Pseudomonas]|uniref:restriction endonuclease subunit S n=1 Tax=unclassified Pseudomonas TaxID=196821 RepID=UPI0008CA8049|nr:MULTISPECIES: restriction endonuclease subunit S [unclassified Pseudomonas]MCD4867153.1 restriction endonuclease subunit S [Pseudomonas sp. PLB05]SEP47278.1 type I restriction enzyme, S subunit [Pseudomonas sp. Snoq117.2]
MTALLTENMPLLAGAPNGIKKLRELILELAVRGKLVPQDPNDEPASELLKRIAEEKARLVAEGKIKKAKATREELAEVSYEIPSSWAVASLGQVVEIVRGITFPASEKSKEPEPGRVACLRTANVQDEIEWDDLLYIRESFVSRHDQYVEPHDIVMSMANSRELVGKVALIGAELKQKTTFGGFLGVLRPMLIEPRFVMALLRTPNARSALIDSASQTTNIANVSLAKLRPLPFAIPPLAEQHRIVAKVDELMALCDRLEAQQADADSAHAQLVQALLGGLTQARDAEDFAQSWQRLAEHFDTLFTTESSIDALKQTLLQLAVMGKLVPQDSGDEPASTLLKRIAEEKARLVVEGKIKKQKLLAQIGADEGSSKVSSGWELVRFGQLIELISGQHLGPDEYFDSPQDGAIPYLTGPAEFGEVHPQPTRFTHERRATSIQGDILLTVKGSGVGKTNFVDQVELAISRQLMAIRPVLLDTQFTRYLLLSMAEHFQSKSIGIAIPGISREDVLDAPIGLPPLPEQHRIVAKVDQLMTLCDQLKARLGQARQVHEQLANALVEQAVA